MMFENVYCTLSRRPRFQFLFQSRRSREVSFSSVMRQELHLTVLLKSHSPRRVVVYVLLPSFPPCHSLFVAEVCVDHGGRVIEVMKTRQPDERSA